MMRSITFCFGLLILQASIVSAALSISDGALPSTSGASTDPLVQKAVDAKKEGPAAAAAKAFVAGRFDEAVKLARPLADEGDADAMFLLGLAHETGQGLEQSRDQALVFYRKAAARGHKDAGYRVPLILLASEKSSERDEARKSLEAAAKSDAAVAGRILGEAWLRGRLSEKPDPVKAKEWWTRAADAGDLQSMKILAGFYEGQFGFPEQQDAKQALRLYGKAAMMGDTGVMVTLGSRLLNGKEALRDETRGREWLKKAVEQGEFSACLVLGDYEEKVKKDYKAALAAYERGKDGGQIDCMLRVADFYLQGLGVDKDEPRGMALLIKAAEAGNPQAQFRVAAGLLAGEKPDIGAGYLQLLSSANNGFLPAQNEIGLFYLSGKLGAADAPAAVAWLTRAAKSGYAAAQHNLGTLYEAGAAGLERNLQNAGELYGLAAQQGHDQATLALARLCCSTTDSKANLPKAWALASLVAEKGNEDAKKMAEQIDGRLDAGQRKKAKEVLAEIKKPAEKPAP